MIKNAKKCKKMQNYAKKCTFEKFWATGLWSNPLLIYGAENFWWMLSVSALDFRFPISTIDCRFCTMAFIPIQLYHVRSTMEICSKLRLHVQHPLTPPTSISHIRCRLNPWSLQNQFSRYHVALLISFETNCSSATSLRHWNVIMFDGILPLMVHLCIFLTGFKMILWRFIFTLMAQHSGTAWTLPVLSCSLKLLMVSSGEVSLCLIAPKMTRLSAQSFMPLPLL